MEGETFQNTSWVNHFSTQSVKIGNLSPDLYEFKTVARNDYPDQVNPKTSPASDVTEARPLPSVSSKFLSFVTQVILDKNDCFVIMSHKQAQNESHTWLLLQLPAVLVHK